MSFSAPFSRSKTLIPIFVLALVLLLPLTLASSGDRNPTFQHCLRGCGMTYCDPSQPPIPAYLRAFGWTCAENCAYSCAHSFTDNIRPGSRYHQFYGKWAFYRLGPFQEPFSILMSLGNLYVNLRGLETLKRRVRPENKLRPWLTALAYIQINTWVWSTVFHARDTPNTERLDYFSATLTIGFTLLYAIVRIFHLQTPVASSRLLFPASAAVGFIILGHFTYLLSFPKGAFPYGYHTKFALALGMAHNLLWVAWSFSFKFPYPSFTLGSHRLAFPKPYPPNDPFASANPPDASTPALLVALTTLAMSFELLDFAPVFRLVDAHSLWHMATIPLTLAWWHFLTTDAVQLEGSLLGQRGMGYGGTGGSGAEGGLGLGAIGGDSSGSVGEPNLIRSPLIGGLSSPMMEPPRTPTFAQLAAGGSMRLKSPSPSPARSPKVDKPE
ncbi:hypothetical protein IAT38_007910 [Cryptococcus sp. DSM 104549]